MSCDPTCSPGAVFHSPTCPVAHPGEVAELRRQLCILIDNLKAGREAASMDYNSNSILWNLVSDAIVTLEDMVRP